MFCYRERVSTERLTIASFVPCWGLHTLMVATSISSIKYVGMGADERKICSLASLLKA
jgi:hypothetical protein